MNKRYATLFERTAIGGMTLKNRIVMCPMGTLSDETDGYLSQSQMDYYEMRARGGTGLIIVEGQSITGKYDPWFQYNTVATNPSRQVQTWRKLTERIKPYGTKVCLQLVCGLGAAGFPPPNGEAPLYAPSELPAFYSPGKTTQALTVDQIHDLVASHGQAAARAKQAGVDCVEIHGHVGYLIDQFMTPFWNHRTDEYGGTFENRMRLPVEILQSIREAVGPDFPILFRHAVDHKFEGGRTLEEGLEIVQYLDAAGVDAFDIDYGAFLSHNWIMPPAYLGDACMVDGAAAVKAITSKPVLNAGNFTPETAVEAVETGKTDYIMIGRGLIADPDWANKLYYGQRDDLRPCIRCNQYCTGNLMSGCVVSCAVNAAAGTEQHFAITRTEEPKTVVIVGGGPGGMEAARVAALKGHKVKLYDKNSILGGQVVAAVTPSFKTQLKAYMAYLENQVRKLAVEIHLDTSITADSEELQGADQIIVAVGASPLIPKISGLESSKVIEASEAHIHRRAEVGQNVVVCGGGLTGCDLALELAMEGKNVTIVEMADRVAMTTNYDNILCLTAMLPEQGVVIMAKTKVVGFTEQGVEVENPDGNVTTLEADTVILAFGTRPNATLAESICSKYPTAQAIGDCTKIGQVGDAVRQGYFAAWAIQ